MYAIFGATGGIGSALAQRLAKHPNATLVLVGRDAGKLDKAVASLAAQPSGGLTVLQADVTDAKQVR